MDIARRKSVRAGNRAAETKLFKKLDKLNFDTEINTAGPLIDAIKKKQDVISKLDERIVESTSDEDIEPEITDADEYNVEIETNLRKYQKLVSKSANPQNVPGQSDSEFIPTLPQTNYLSSQNHRLRKLTLPTFAGDILEWQYFWDSFETTIHNNHTLTEVQKFSYLKSLLTAEATNVINGLTLSSSNYCNAVELLTNRYGQKHKIINAYMKVLLDLPAPLDTLDILRNFSYKSEALIRGLESLGHCQDMYGPLLIPITLGKLPAGVKRNITRENGNDNWTLTNLRMAIQKEISILEVSQTEHTNSSFTNNTAANFHTGIDHISRMENGNEKERNTSCFYCRESHYSTDCHNINEIKSRWDFVRNNKPCFNCLGNHTVSNCRSKHNCRKCHRRHHTSLCCNDSAESDQTKSDITILHASSVGQNSAVFLKTAVAPIYSNTQCKNGCILFDEGAQKSFISQDLADNLNVKIDGKEVLNITAFGDTTTKVRVLDRTTVELRADSGETLPFSVLIVPTIAAPLRNYRRNISGKLNYLHGLKLAHPPSDDVNFQISLLIGADHYWDVVKDEIIRGNGPTAMNSKIGYLLSGTLNIAKIVSHNSHMMNTLASYTKDQTVLQKHTKRKSTKSQNTNHWKPRPTEKVCLQAFETACSNNQSDSYFLKHPWYGGCC